MSLRAQATETFIDTQCRSMRRAWQSTFVKTTLQIPYIFSGFSQCATNKILLHGILLLHKLFVFLTFAVTEFCNNPEKKRANAVAFPEYVCYICGNILITEV